MRGTPQMGFFISLLMELAVLAEDVEQKSFFLGAALPPLGPGIVLQQHPEGAAAPGGLLHPGLSSL
jgi:hypothetical protein